MKLTTNDDDERWDGLTMTERLEAVGARMGIALLRIDTMRVLPRSVTNLLESYWTKEESGS
jgi:hypothetical protein